jgi:hypothetical protein
MQQTLRGSFSSIASLARNHDDLPAFNAAYWVLTFLGAILFNAGAFVALIAGRIAFDVYRYREAQGKRWKKVAEGVARENVLDVSLLALAITFSVYFHSALPLIAGLQGLLRTLLALFNGVVQIVVKMHVLRGVVTAVAGGRNHLFQSHPRMGKKLSSLEAASIATLAASLALLAASPWALSLDASEIKRMATDVLIPWNL